MREQRGFANSLTNSAHLLYDLADLAPIYDATYAKMPPYRRRALTPQSHAASSANLTLAFAHGGDPTKASDDHCHGLSVGLFSPELLNIRSKLSTAQAQVPQSHLGRHYCSGPQRVRVCVAGR